MQLQYWKIFFWTMHIFLLIIISVLKCNIHLDWKSLLFSKVIRSLLQSQQVALQVAEPLLKLSSSTLQANFSSLRLDIHIKDLITSIFHSNLAKPIEFPLKDLFTFAKSLLKWSSFHHEILPKVLHTCQSKLYNGLSNEDIKDIVLLLVEVVLSGIVDNEYGADVKSKHGLIYFPKCATKTGAKILDCLLECLVVGKEADLSLVWGVLIILPCLRWVPVRFCFFTVWLPKLGPLE